MIVPQVKPPVNLFLKKMSGFFRLARSALMWYPVGRKNAPYRRLFFPGKETTMRIMAIDYGDAHTGIAVSDPTGLLAGFTTVINAYRPDRVAEQIALLAKEHGAERLVLGHPINMDGTRGPRSEKAQAMRQLLEETTGLPVALWDERRTTIDAHQILMSSGKNAKKRKKVVDAVAASLILEGYLTYLKTHPEG